MLCSRALASLILVFTLGITGCSQQSVSSALPTAPSWILQPPSEQGMAYGVGSMEIYADLASAVKRATDIARADLASQLRVTVTAQFSSSTTATRGAGESQMQQQLNHYVRSKIPATELDNIRTVETWQDGRFAYALVALNRHQEAANLRYQISELDTELDALAELQPQGNKLQQLQPLLPALTLLAKRQDLNDKLSFINDNGRTEPLPTNIKQLEQRIYQKIDQLSVGLTLNNAAAQQVKAELLEGFLQQGLKLQTQAELVDLRFVVAVQLQQQQRQGSYYSFATAQVQIEDAQGRVLNSFSQQAKGVSGMAQQAQQKALAQLSSLIGSELAATLVTKLH